MPTYLIQADGRPFEDTLLAAARADLDLLDDESRKVFRNDNSDAIAAHAAQRLLVVSGPGTGKSHMFLSRIRHWMQAGPDVSVLVLSFVRKLVGDLQRDIVGSSLTEEQKHHVTASTLHRLARSIVERTHGTVECPMRPHIRIIAWPWDDLVWADVLLFHPEVATSEEFCWRACLDILHQGGRSPDGPWSSLFVTYHRLSRFYNAAGFADLIVRARTCLHERPEMREHHYLIVDEYQDFNLAEEELVSAIGADVRGLLLAGDDDQVLYETLKAGDPSLIRTKYKDEATVNAMLPFCGRCSTYITRAASGFLEQIQEEDRIPKIFLPISGSSNCPKVKVVGCATPSGAVEFIDQWFTTHAEALAQRTEELRNGQSKEAYLLILTPSLKGFYQKADEKLRESIGRYQISNVDGVGRDYRALAIYYALSLNPADNYDMRRVLYLAEVLDSRVHEMLNQALEGDVALADMEEPEIIAALSKAARIGELVAQQLPAEDLARAVESTILVSDCRKLAMDLAAQPLDTNARAALEQATENAAEQRDTGEVTPNPVDIMTIVGAKGLSAEHVIVIGCDDVNMSRVTPKAFYVGLTRARTTVTLLVAAQARGGQKPHAFIRLLPEDAVEFVKFTKMNGEELLGCRTDFVTYFDRLQWVRNRASART